MLVLSVALFSPRTEAGIYYHKPIPHTHTPFPPPSSLPLTQCKQKFAAMDVQSRDNLKQSIDDSAKKYQLDDITYGSFVAQFGYKTKVNNPSMTHCDFSGHYSAS